MSKILIILIFFARKKGEESGARFESMENGNIYTYIFLSFTFCLTHVHIGIGIGIGIV